METYGRYSLLDAIGAGGVTQSFRAKRRGIEGFEKDLVVKRVHPRLADDSGFIEIFLTDVRDSVSLSHGSIAQVLDLGSVDQDGAVSYFLATEYVAGLTLAEVVDLVRACNTRIPAKVGLYVATELAKALVYAHRQHAVATAENAGLGIVHGGISLHDVMMSHEGEIKVTDFRLTSVLLRNNQRVGVAPANGVKNAQETLLSPEQLAGAPASSASDVFSMAALTYRCLLAGLADEHEALGTPFTQLLERRKLPNLGALRPDLPPSTSALLGRALLLDSEQRLATAATFHEELLDLIAAGRLRCGRAEIAAWLHDLNNQAAVLRRPTPLEADPARSEAASLESPKPSETRDVTILALHSSEDLSLHEQDKGTALMSRFTERVTWISATHAQAVFQENDGRATETAVRCGLALLRALRGKATSIGIGVDLATTRLDEAKRSGPWGSGISDLDRQGAFRLALRAGSRVVVTRRAARELRNLFKLKRLDNDTLAVVGTRSVEQASGAFFGRQRELIGLYELLERQGSDFAPAAVIGPTGIGKTRLLTELSRCGRHGKSKVKVCVAACPPQGRNLAYSGAVALLGRLCEVREGDSFDQWEQAKHRLEAKGFGWQDIELVLRMIETSPLPGRESDVRLVDTLLRHLEARFHEVVVLDNAHRLDSESARVLGNVLAELSIEPLTFIFSARTRGSEPTPGVDLPLLHLPELVTFPLEPLSAADQRGIILSRLHVQSIPESMEEYFLARAKGNPFVLEELLREGIGQGHIVLAPGRVKAFRPHLPFVAPRSVRALDGAR